MIDYDYDEYDEDNWDYAPDDYWVGRDVYEGEYDPTYAYEPDEEYYDNWNPEVNRPAWYMCRECNGMGSNPYSDPCEACDMTGVRYHAVYRLLTLWDRLKTFVNSFHRCRECGRFFRSEYGDPSLCESCDCWPF